MSRSELVEIEEIRGKQKDGKKILYLLKLKNQPESENAWFESKDVLDKDMIKEYETKLADPNIKWKWQYYLPSVVDNKSEGWYDMDSNNSNFIEQELAKGKTTCTINTLKFNYNIDMVEMGQTNTTHSDHTKRFLRRVTIS